MENSKNTVTDLSEKMVIEILARLPLRSISRFKSVCKTWKSILESLNFRCRFLSLHQNKSRSWSLLCHLKGYMIDFHRCQTWGLPKSLCYYFCNIFERLGNIIDSSNGLVLIEAEYKRIYYVGNPILQQWVVLYNLTPYPRMAHLVTRVDEYGVVLSFKVVTIDAMTRSEDRSSTCLEFCVYSSETGIWTIKQLHCPCYFSYIKPPIITLHEMLYIRPDDNDVIIGHDFYGESNVCWVIPLPYPDLNNHGSLTTSAEFVIYMKTLPNNVLKVWRLVNTDDGDDSPWELLWETRLEFISSDDSISSYAPVIMHPFDNNIVYLWSPKNNSLVSCNLKTQNNHIFIDQLQEEGDLQNCLENHSVCEKHVDGLCALYLHGGRRINYSRFEYLVPRWMGSIPSPPHTEILDTTSLLSRIKSILF